MEIAAGGMDRWRWACGWARPDGVEPLRGVVNSFPVFGLVAAHGFFWIDHRLTERLVGVCELEAGRVQSIAQLTSALHKAVCSSSFPDDDEEFSGVEAGLAFVSDEQVAFANVGGAGIFLRSRSGTTQLAQPQTQIHQLVEAGVVTQADRSTHPLRVSLANALYPRLGSPPTWDSGRVTLEPGDQIVIVSLNLSWMIEESGGDALDEFPASAEDCVRDVLALDRDEPEASGSYAVVLERTRH